MKTSKHRRVQREQVIANAANQANKNRGGFLKLPDNVREWVPDTASGINLNILPYVVSVNNHPDNVESGCLWYKYPFAVHFNIGLEQQAVVCPTSVGQPCPICKEQRKLAKNWEENEEAAKALRPQRWVMYNIIDPDDDDRIAIFSFSRGKFAEFLETELMEGDESNLAFYDVNQDGRTLKVRFSKDSFAGRSFLKATRIDFVKREAMDEDEILAKTVCLDTILQILSYAEVEKIFHGGVFDGDDSPKPTPKPKTNAKPKSEVEEPDPEIDEPESEPDTVDEPNPDELKPTKSSSKKTAPVDDDDSIFNDDEIPW